MKQNGYCNGQMSGLIDDVRTWFSKQADGTQDVLKTVAQKVITGTTAAEISARESEKREKLMKGILIASGAGVGLLGLFLIIKKK